LCKKTGLHLMFIILNNNISIFGVSRSSFGQVIYLI
jgi:hypothetical protein